MLSKFFKPRWNHASADVRLKAVAQLSAADVEDNTILLTLAQGDSSPAVRCAAISALIEPEFLLTLYQTDSDPAIKQAAGQQLVNLLTGHQAGLSADNRLRHLRLLKNQALLQHALQVNTDNAAFDAILANLTDEHVLLEQAINGSKPEQRLTAAQRIHQPELLRQLVRDGRDKKVQQHARTLLKAYQDADKQAEEQQQALQALLTDLQRLANIPMDSLNGAKLQQLRDSFIPLQAVTSAELEQQINALLTTNQTRFAQWQQQQQQAASLAAAQAEQQSLLQTFQQQLDGLAQPGWDTNLDALTTTLSHLQEQWQQSIRLNPAAAKQQAAFDQLTASWQQVVTLLEQLQTLLQSQAADPTTNITDRLTQLQRQWPAKVIWPRLAASLKPAQNTTNKSAAKASKTALHANLLNPLRKSLHSRNLRWANRNWQRLAQALEERPDTLSAQQADNLKSQLDELRDWHAFAATPKKEALCTRMEALATQPLNHPEEQANAIQALHDEWHQLMSANQDADQTLWDRFKTASDQAYHPCKVHFEALDQQRAANLEKRVNICRQLADFIESEAIKTTQGQAIFAIRQQAPKDWQAASPVRFTDAREVQQQFNQLLKTLDQHLDNVSQQHVIQLQALLEQIEQASHQSTTQDAVEQVKKLQREWKSVGWAHPRDYRKLDQQRQRLCDRIFNQHQIERQAEQQKNAALVDGMKAALHKLQELLDSAPTPEPLHAATAELKQLSEPVNNAALIKQKQQLLKQADSRIHQLEQAKYWAQWQTAIQQAANTEQASDDLLALCVALEASAGIDSPAFAQQARLKWQVTALEKALKGGSKSPLEQCAALFEDSAAMLAKGLDSVSRQRLSLVIDQLLGFETDA